MLDAKNGERALRIIRDARLEAFRLYRLSKHWKERRAL
jgi:hypothetical protein